MDLALTKTGDYAVRAALALAKAFPSGGYRKIREVAEEMDVPLRYAPQILNLLAKADLAEARAGQQGGYRLKRSPAEITLLQVVQAAEGPLRPDRCTLRGGPCHWEDVCPLHATWDLARKGLTAVLEETTLAAIAEADQRIEQGAYEVPADSHRKTRVTRQRRAPAKTKPA